jgi:hypothetical protein
VIIEDKTNEVGRVFTEEELHRFNDDEDKRLRND